MTNRAKIELGHVQKTLFLPLWGRAVESKKRHPMLVDETAVKIIEQIEYDFAPLTQKMDELSQIAWVKRSQICDQVIKHFLTHYPNGTIVNLGCGLDTTFERIDFTSTLSAWITSAFSTVARFVCTWIER